MLFGWRWVEAHAKQGQSNRKGRRKAADRQGRERGCSMARAGSRSQVEACLPGSSQLQSSQRMGWPERPESNACKQITAGERMHRGGGVSSHHNACGGSCAGREGSGSGGCKQACACPHLLRPATPYCYVQRPQRVCPFNLLPSPCRACPPSAAPPRPSTCPGGRARLCHSGTVVTSGHKMPGVGCSAQAPSLRPFECLPARKRAAPSRPCCCMASPWPLNV